MPDQIPHRRSIRLPQYDYTSAGAYFVTICAWHRHPLFGCIINGTFELNPIGQMVREVWNELINYPGVDLDEFIVMPDHVHGIIVLNRNLHVGATPRGCPDGLEGQAQGPAPTVFSLPDVIHRFKSFTTTRYHRTGMTSKLWQRNYYEHVIRNQSELYRCRQYIRHNVMNPHMA